MLPSNSKDIIFTDPILDSKSCLTDNNIFGWDFDATLHDDSALIDIADAIFETIPYSSFGIERETLKNLVRAIAASYRPNSFHSFKHAVGVMHFTSMMLTYCDSKEVGHVSPATLTPFMKFGTLLSALGHDADHPGNTNAFEVANNTEIAMKYSNQSVLEHHHFETTYGLIVNSSLCNIFKNMNLEQEKFLRELLETCILATDMRRHTELVDLMTIAPWKDSPLPSSDYDIETNKTRILLCNCVLHASDLSNPVRKFTVAVKWGEKLAVEFNNEVNLQRKFGLPLAIWMETHNQEGLYKKECGFCTHVALPMWVVLADLFPICEKLVVQLRENISTYETTSFSIANEV